MWRKVNTTGRKETEKKNAKTKSATKKYDIHSWVNESMVVWGKEGSMA